MRNDANNSGKSGHREKSNSLCDTILASPFSLHKKGATEVTPFV